MDKHQKQPDHLVAVDKGLQERVLRSLSDNSVAESDLRKSFYDVLSKQKGDNEALLYNLGKLAFHADLPCEVLAIISNLNSMGCMDSGTILAMVGQKQYNGDLKRKFRETIEQCKARGHFRAKSALAVEKFRWLGPLCWLAVIPYRVWILVSALVLRQYSPNDPRANVSVTLLKNRKR